MLGLWLSMLVLACVNAEPSESASFGGNGSSLSSAFHHGSHKRGIHLEGPQRIRFPATSVSENPEILYSGNHNLRLANFHHKKGWSLSGRIFKKLLIGRRSFETIPAELKFKSITWIQGGNGSAVGITMHPDGQRIEADPSFGMGIYNIEFEVAIHVPAFAYADSYHGVSLFSIR